MHLCEERLGGQDVRQPLLDDVPGGICRQLPCAIQWLKEQEWDSVSNWMQVTWDQGDADDITATSDDTDPSPRNNMLGSLASFRPTSRHGQKSHQKVSLRIIAAFYDAGLINLKLGKHRETALLKAAACGNIEIARLLLEHGAGIPRWLLPGLFIRNFFPRGRACILRLGLRRGGCGV